jgi:hypothetical protein
MQTFRSKRGKSEIALPAGLLIIITILSIAITGLINRDKADSSFKQEREVWKSSVITFSK